jgi:hypothetical protein
MPSHPFTGDDALCACFHHSEIPMETIEDIIHLVWSNAVARGAVQIYDSSMELPTPHAIIKLPEDRP